MIYAFLALLTYPVVRLLSLLKPKSGRKAFLVFQTAKIGDMICTTPVFREIKKAHPNAKLGVVINPVATAVLKYNPRIDEIIELPPGGLKGLFKKLAFARLLYKKGYTDALILLPNAANILSAYWAAIPKRVCIYPESAGGTLKSLMRLNTATVPHGEKTSLETYLKALGQFSIQSRSIDKEVYSAPEAENKATAFLAGKGPFIGIIPSTANALKNWGEENFVALSKRLLEETNATVVFAGAKEDGEISAGLTALYGKERVLNACGSFSLAEAPALIKKLSLAIGVDTGLIYMADALDVPVVDIAGPCDMKNQRPMGKNSFIVQKKELVCVPCSHTFQTPYKCRYNHRKCVTGITVDEVFACALKALRH